MTTNYLLITQVHFAALLLTGCGAKEAPVLTVPKGAKQAT